MANKKLICVLIFMISIISFVHAQYKQKQVYRVSSSDSKKPSEVSVAINPINPEHIVVAALEYDHPNKEGGISNYNYITLDNGIYVNWSVDGGYNWSSPLIVVDHINTVQPFEDKPWIGIDMLLPIHKGNVYISWTRFDSYGSPSQIDSSYIFFSYLTGTGRSFSVPIRISDGAGDAKDGSQTMEGAVPAVDSKGNIWVAWAGPKGIYLDCSLDGGKTFGQDRVIAEQPEDGMLRLMGYTVLMGCL